MCKKILYRETNRAPGETTRWFKRSQKTDKKIFRQECKNCANSDQADPVRYKHIDVVCMFVSPGIQSWNLIFTTSKLENE